MGGLTLSAVGTPYIDTNALIYSIERIAPYAPLLDIFWRDLAARRGQAVSSELIALETLVGPMRAGDTVLEALFRQALYSSPDLRLVPISRAILEQAARLRASLPSLKAPDAIHASTALAEGCSLFITNNDPIFNHVPGLPTLILSDALTP